MRMRWIGMWLAGILLVLAVGPLEAQEETGLHVGSARCGECHAYQYKVWTQSAHQRAQASLPPANQKDPRCERCHTAGSGAEGIGCEDCHGPGKYYARRYVMKDAELSRIVGLVDAKAEDCLRCHTDSAPTINAFDYPRMWAQIAHLGSNQAEATDDQTAWPAP